MVLAAVGLFVRGHAEPNGAIDAGLIVAATSAVTMVVVAGAAALFLYRSTGDQRVLTAGVALVALGLAAIGVTRLQLVAPHAYWLRIVAILAPPMGLLALAPFEPAVRSRVRAWHIATLIVAVETPLYLATSVFPGDRVHLGFVGTLGARERVFVWMVALVSAMAAVGFVKRARFEQSAALGNLSLMPIGLCAGAVVMGVADSANRPCAWLAVALGAGASGLALTSQVVAHQRRDRARVLDALVAANAATTRSHQIAASSADDAHEARAALLGIEAAWQGIVNHRDSLTELQFDELAGGVLSEVRRLRTLVAADRTDVGPRGACDQRQFSVREALSGVTAVAQCEFGDLRVNVPATLQAIGRSDDVAQIVRALLNNAHRHAAGSVVDLGARRVGDEVVVWVADDGSGIAAELAEVVFDRGVTSGPTAGTGIGLSVARQLAESQGGSLRLVSNGRGCLFQLRLRAAGDEQVGQKRHLAQHQPNRLAALADQAAIA